MERVKTVLLLAAALLLLSAQWPAYASSAPSDLQSDPYNCGAVGFRVPAGAICSQGAVVYVPR